MATYAIIRIIDLPKTKNANLGPKYLSASHLPSPLVCHCRPRPRRGAGILVPEVDLDIIGDQLRFDPVRDARLVAVEVQSIGDNLTLNI